MDQQTLDELTAWIDAYAAATDDTLADLVAAVLMAYRDVDPYSARSVADAAQEAADQSNVATLLAAGIAAQYVTSAASIVTDAPIPVPPPSLLLIRNGANMRDVYSRPAKMVRRLVAKDVPLSEAWRQALSYVENIADGDIRLAQRQAVHDTMRALGVTKFRRIVRPELSKTGSCGLCIAASDRTYQTSLLMPIHDRCKCTVMPIVGALDPGSSLNNLALGDLYGDANGTAAKLLKRTKYAINEHGEWGPILTVDGQTFTGPQDLTPVAA